MAKNVLTIFMNSKESLSWKKSMLMLWRNAKRL